MISCLKEDVSTRLDLDAYRALIDRLRSYNYPLIQYIPSRQSILVGQEKIVLSSFVFRRRPCIFNSSLFQPLYLSIFRLLHPQIYMLFTIFFRGARFTKETLVNCIFSEEDFKIFVEKGLFQKFAGQYRSSYRFIPIGKVILVGKFNDVSEGYVHTGYDTIVLYDNLKDFVLHTRDIERALEVGCGSGFLSLFVAGKAERLDAVDLNHEAVRLTKINTGLNNAVNINAFESDVYNNINGKYDYIFSNPPFELLPEENRNLLHSFGGASGSEITKRILEGLDEHLSESGTAHIISNTYIRDSGGNTLEEIIKKIFSGKKFDITLKELSYQLSPEYYGYYKTKGIVYSILYFITIRRSDSYRLREVPLNFLQKIHERIRLVILRLISKRYSSRFRMVI